MFIHRKKRTETETEKSRDRKRDREKGRRDEGRGKEEEKGSFCPLVPHLIKVLVSLMGFCLTISSKPHYPSNLPNSSVLRVNAPE